MCFLNSEREERKEPCNQEPSPQGVVGERLVGVVLYFKNVDIYFFQNKIYLNDNNDMVVSLQWYINLHIIMKTHNVEEYIPFQEKENKDKEKVNFVLCYTKGI